MTTWINHKVYLIMKDDIPMNQHWIFPHFQPGGVMCFAKEEQAQKDLEFAKGKKWPGFNRARVDTAMLSWEKYEDD